MTLSTNFLIEHVTPSSAIGSGGCEYSSLTHADIHATPSTRLEGRLLYSERCRSRSSVSRHVVSAVVWPGAWFGGKNARPCLTEKAVDDPLTFSGRGHQGHIYIWTPLDVLWKDIGFLLEAWCSCWNNLAFLWKKQRVTRNKGIQVDGNSSCHFSERCGGFPDVRHNVASSQTVCGWLNTLARLSLAQ